MRTSSSRLAFALALTLAGSLALPATADAAGKKKKAAAEEAEQDDEPEVKLPPLLLKTLHEKEAEVTAARREAIGLIESYLRDSPRSKEQAEALYKLAELYWEEAKAVYLEKMARYQGAVTACHNDRAECPKVPRKPPSVDLAQAQAVYLRLINQYPKFRKIDTVIYLYAFSLRDQGKTGESIKYFQTILDKYPRSRYIADAWMAIAEYRFYEQQNYKSSLEAYEKVLQHPKSQLYDLALFKTAWCYWKLGDTTKSAMRFKDVLDLAKKKAGRSEDEQKRAAELQGQALDYLVELFTEDDTKSAHDAFEFLAQIGGKQYSRKVLKQLADTVFDQTRYERAVEAYRLLIELDPNSAEAPDYHGKIVESYQLLGDVTTAVAEMRKLANNYGGRSPWAAANKDRPKALEHARTLAEGLIRTLAKTMHAEAQQNEKTTKVVDKVRYARAAEAYEFYLANFPDAADATELRYLRADILYFKLGKYEDAGREYLAVGKSQPVGKYHKDALLQAMGAFEKVRKPGEREITESDRLFGEAADLYAVLFPKDKEIVTVIYKNGQFFFDYGDYDEAVKRFGLIVERYPDDPNAGAAGDRILQALNKAKNYENIEAWARRLKKTKAFSSKEEQDRLDKLIVGSVMKSGEKYAAEGKYDKAASFYMRVPREYPSNGLAPKALNNAGAVLEKAKKPEEACAAYKELADKYPERQRGARRVVHGGAHPGERRVLRQGRGVLRAAGHEVPAEPARGGRAAQRGRVAPEPGTARSRHQALRRIRAPLQGSLGRQDRRVPGRGRARGSEGLARRRRQLRRLRQELPRRRAQRGGARARGRRAPQGRQRKRRQGRRAEGAVGVWRRRQTRRQEADRERRGRELLGGAGALHPGRARLPRLREDQDRGQAAAAGQGARGEGEAARGGEVHLPGRRELQVARVGDGRRCCASDRATRRTPSRCATRPSPRTSTPRRSSSTATSSRRWSW